MNENDMRDNKQNIQNLLVVGKNREAELLCRVLWETSTKEAEYSEHDSEWRLYLGHVYATLVSDREGRDESVVALKMLESEEDFFSIFLRFRLCLTAYQCQEAMDLAKK